MTIKNTESEPQTPFFSGWRRALLWLLGAGALAVVGYRGTLGTESAAATPPVNASAAPTASERPPPAAGSASAAPVLRATAAHGPASALPGTPPSAEPATPPDAAPAGTAAPAARDPLDRSAAAAGGDAAAGADAANHIAAAPQASALTADGKIVLNVASEAELRKLPGIGKSRARAIVEQRERVGRFRRLEDLLRVKGIGRKRLAALRSKVVLDAP